MQKDAWLSVEDLETTAEERLSAAHCQSSSEERSGVLMAVFMEWIVSGEVVRSAEGMKVDGVLFIVEGGFGSGRERHLG